MNEAEPSEQPKPPAGRVRFSRRPGMQAGIALAARGAGGLVRVLGHRRSGTVAGWVGRTASPFVPESRLALENLRRAFPEKSEAERKEILRGAWDNLARTVAELPLLRRIVLKNPDDPTAGLSDRIEVVGAEWIRALRDDGRTGIAFLAHLGNWELLSPFIASFGARPAALYRAPPNRRLLEELMAWRGDTAELIASGPGAARRVVAEMRGGNHLCMLVDQRLTEGLPVPFFGRPAPTNPIVGRMARQFDCPVVGVRSIRLPGGRFRVEVTPPLDLPRDAEGRIDVLGTTALVTSIVEGWVREHPDQWLWLHNRWGDPR